METWLSAVLGGIGVALIGLLGNVVIQWMNRRKTAAEAGSAVASGADEVVESTLKWARELRIDMATLKQRVAELETENAELKQTVREQGEMIRQLQAELEQYRAREECPD